MVISLLKQKSQHHVETHPSEALAKINLDEYDVVHLHCAWNASPFFHRLSGRKVVLSLHDFRLQCNSSLRTCEAIKYRFGCVSCRGLIPYLYSHFKRYRPLKKFVENFKPRIVVDSRYMQKVYVHLHPTYLPIPLETELMNPIPFAKREGYLFFSGRASIEKNPLDFAKLCRNLEVKGKIALQNLSLCGYFIDYMKELKKYPVEVYIDPEREELFNLYRHAKTGVFPNLFPEPFGISVANSLLFEVPVVAYPLGNLKHLATVPAYSFQDLTKKADALMNNEDFYLVASRKVKKQRDFMMKEHGHEAIKKWDEFYRGLEE